jgi:hypothetical protein
MNPTDEHLRRFLVRYGEALSAGDLKAISGCYAVPALVLSDEGSIPIAARQEIEAAFDGAAERYRAQGLVALQPTLVASEALSERLLSVDMRWATSTSRVAARSKTATATCSGSRTRRHPRSKSS